MLRLLFAFVLPAAALGCSCVESGPPCASTGGVSAVFLGTVQELTHDSMEPDEHGNVQVNGYLGTHAVFEVSEGLVGMEGRGKQVEIRTGMGGGDCGYPFELGKSYVVYAYAQQDGMLVADICSRTGPAERAQADLTYLRSVRSGTAPTFVVGVVGDGESRKRHYDAELGTYLPDGVAGATVTIAGAGKSKTMTTGEDGLFRFDQLSPGKYKVSISKESYSLKYGFGNERQNASGIDVRQGSCAYVPVWMVVDRRIRGTVIAANGDPAAGVEVEIVPLRPTEENSLPFAVAQAKTDGNGIYELKNVRPGEYYLGVNLAHTPSQDMPYTRWFYPGTEDPAKAITAVVNPGPKTVRYDFTIPAPQHERTVEGFVYWPDGRPASEVNIFLEDPRWPWQTNLVQASTDGSGHFTVKAFEGTRYRLHAVSMAEFADEAISAEPLPLNTDTDVSHPLKLYLTRKGMSTVELIGQGLERWRAGLGF